MRRILNLSKISLIGAFITIFILSAGCSLFDSFDSKGHVRFKNNTNITFSGVRVDGGAEYNNSFAPSALTGYMDNEAGNFGVEVKVGTDWTYVAVTDGTLSITTGNKYTVSIDGTAGNYSATQVKD